MQNFLNYQDNCDRLKRGQIIHLYFKASDLYNCVINIGNLHNDQEQKKGHHNQALGEMTLVDDGDRVGSLESDDYEGAMHDAVDQMQQHVSAHENAVLFVYFINVSTHICD